MEKLIPLPYELHVGEGPHPELPGFDLYHSGHWSGAAVNYEEALLLYALVLATKPNVLLETGAHRGFSTLHLALALQHNGFGKLFSIELDQANCNATNAHIQNYGLQDYAQCIHDDSRSFINNTGMRFDFAFLDSEIPLRPKEFILLREKLNPKSLVAIHDSSPRHPMRGKTDIEKELEGEIIIHIPTPRGLTIIQVP